MFSSSVPASARYSSVAHLNGAVHLNSAAVGALLVGLLASAVFFVRPVPPVPVPPVPVPPVPVPPVPANPIGSGGGSDGGGGGIWWQ